MKPIFICGHRKSGTTMLVNLFDSVDNITTYPDDNGLFYKFYPTIHENKKISLMQKKKKLLDLNKNLLKIISSINCVKKNKDILIKNYNNFNKLYSKNLNNDLSLENIIKSRITSFKNAFYPLNDSLYWVEKTTSTEIYASYLSKLLPDSKFIHLIRDPRDNWASLKSGWNKRYQRNNNSINELLFSLIFRLSIGYEMSELNLNTIGKNRYKVIKYEDLVNNPKLIMRDISDFLQIDFSNKMLKTTNFGYIWKSNNFDGISKSLPLSFNVGSWYNRTSKNEIEIIEFYFKDFLKKNNYGCVTSSIDRVASTMNYYKDLNFKLKPLTK